MRECHYTGGDGPKIVVYKRILYEERVRHRYREGSACCWNSEQSNT